jgi:hypothetical protein
MTKLFVGHARLRWQAPPTPDNPAPTMITSTCSTRSLNQRKYIHTFALAKNFVVHLFEITPKALVNFSLGFERSENPGLTPSH